MAAVFRGDLTNKYYPSSTASSKSASPAPSAPTAPSASTAPTASTSPTASASSSTTSITSLQLCEGSDGKIQEYTGIAGIRRAVNALREKLEADETTDEYLFFRPVTVNDLDKIEKQRYSKLGKGLRLAHCADVETLIIKVLTKAHEVVTRNFEGLLGDQFSQMGVPRRDRRGMLGSTAFKGNSTSKEADGSFAPSAFRSLELDWPTLVLEIGFSASLRKLRTDTKWWLSNSGGHVNIVLIFHIKRATRTITIEKWENTLATPAYATRSTGPPGQNRAQIPIPTQMQTISINQNSVTGAPLTLGFHQIFLRQPNAPEQDLVITAQDLQDWSDDVWALLN